MLDEKEKEERRQHFYRATERAKKVLNHGDKIGLTKCPGTKRTITFECWDGNWIVSKSGVDDYSAYSIYSVNGKTMSFRDE